MKLRFYTLIKGSYNKKLIQEVAKVKYEYKFVEVPLREKGFKTKLGEGFER